MAGKRWQGIQHGDIRRLLRACAIGSQNALIIKVAVTIQDINLQLICNQIMSTPLLIYNKGGEQKWPSFFSMSI